MKNKKPVYPFVGWPIINIVSKVTPTYVRKTERGMANLRLWQLTWLAQLVYHARDARREQSMRIVVILINATPCQMT